MTHRGKLVAALIFLLSMTHPLPGGAEEFEYHIKAEFLERFTRFIEWPDDSAFHSGSSPFTFCVVGKNPFGSYLEDLVAETTIKDKKARLLSLSDLSQVGSCQLLFISNSEEPNLATILAETRGKPILTVGDTPGFAVRGTLINFYKERTFIRFEVNMDAVRKSGLKFNSRLLNLARIVGTETK